ncbi:MAG: glycosyltransferase [Gammaproteobacteria bacterium]|jgi:glycosyltransferase involved in cell wall biosynthesis
MSAISSQGQDAKPLRVLVITRKPHSPSFEQRIKNHIEPLRGYGVEVDVLVYPQSIWAQFKIIAAAKRYQVVWWHRHLLPRLQLWWLRHCARRLVYDFDDPLCFSTRADGYSFIRQRRFAALLKACDAAMVGSHYLQDLALEYCDEVYLIPMAISLPPTPQERTCTGGVELLWLGSESTQKYLESIRPALERIGEMRPDIRLRLVAHRPMEFGKLPVEFVQWSPEAQEQALLQANIGLCPMPDTPWTKGKCPYKVLQYMAYGMPWVGSAVGENLASAGIAGSSSQRGICASDVDEWVQAVIAMVDDSQRWQLGENCREYVAMQHERNSVARQISAALR